MGKKVAIVGAGISGLLACKYTLSKAFQPIVFEASSSIGGVWTGTIESTKLQTPKALYEFSDFPWPSSVTEDFPNQHQVMDYIQSYAQHFDQLKHIKFNTKVCGLEFEGPSEDELQSWSLWGGTGEPFNTKGKWKVTVEDKKSPSTELVRYSRVDHSVWIQADLPGRLCVLCIGRFSGVPNIPQFPPNKGPEEFHGEVIHSMEYAAEDYESEAEFVKGKQVTVVGFQKSALDIAMECSNANGVENPCTVLYKTEHWNVPDYLPWGVPMALLYLNHFSELLFHKPGEGLLLSLLATILSPLRWAFSKFVETYIDKKLGLSKYGMVPKHSFLQEISSCLISTVPEKFYDRVQEGSIVLKKSPKSFCFCQEGILVEGDNSGPVKTDLAYWLLGIEFSIRECIHARIPQLAVIGFSESISNLYTSEMRCRWLAELLGGTFKVPSIKEMEKDVKRWDEYAKRYTGKYYRRSCIGALHIWYNDQMCKDMGWNPKRKKGLLAELFEPYGPTDYIVS
ncbi:hypothetical protein ACLB2K_016352 [Fragaria x ananassa]